MKLSASGEIGVMAQPLLALSAALRFGIPESLADRARTTLRTYMDDYVRPLCALTAFGFVPFGVYRQPDSEGEVYRPWSDGLTVRFVMPVIIVKRSITG